ncbi:hypothetical protein K8B83_18670 [Shewanella inventionis]|uniref:Uncharacterized protein n=1 Tax=Shewanella inventionis TaxID=1738770 RepID=A0ABQ1JA24_9GAMM|nr:hypothetical protein [Shewanella inventionis]MCL1158669.1 hypothetical protein [Shewanella inventionis]UAL42819.1 hypothetical protein K8B83_18670 [Shewanella inventionis]GGB61581.1 hypothetical protein GCM10011607_22900 [Shewanella inventionis]
MTFENMDVFAERPWMGLQRVIEVISFEYRYLVVKQTPGSRLKSIAGTTPYLAVQGGIAA